MTYGYILLHTPNTPCPKGSMNCAQIHMLYVLLYVCCMCDRYAPCQRWGGGVRFLFYCSPPSFLRKGPALNLSLPSFQWALQGTCLIFTALELQICMPMDCFTWALGSQPQSLTLTASTLSQMSFLPSTQWILSSVTLKCEGLSFTSCTI